MTALQLTLTTAGIAAIVDAEAGGTNAVLITQIGLTAAEFVVAPTLTGLPGEYKRLGTIAGEAVDDLTIHLVARDEGAEEYTVRGFALYLDDGTLFGAYGQPLPIFSKSAVSTFLLALDLTFQPGQAALIQFGATNFLYPPATVSRMGVAELATPEEVAAGVDGQRIVTPATLAARLALYIPMAQRGAPNGVATLNAAGKVPTAQLPPAEAIDTFTIDSEAAMLALPAGIGDFARRTDLQKTFTLTVLPATTLGNWIEFLSPGAPVQSVNGKIGAVDLAAADVGAVPTGRMISTTGLATGGGSMAADRTVDVAKASAAEAAAGVNDVKAVTPAALSGILVTIAGKAPAARTITGGGLVTGGGDLTLDRVLNVAKASPAEVAAGIEDGKAITPAGLAGLPKNLTTNGYATLAGGLIIQWGRAVASANGITRIYLPVAFPSAFFSVVAVGTSESNNNAQDNWPVPFQFPDDLGSFRVFNANNLADAVMFIAVGA